MLFAIVSILVLGGTFLGIAFHRFWTTREEAKSTILYAEIFKKYLAWLALRTVQMSRKASPRAWWEYVKALPLWRLARPGEMAPCRLLCELPLPRRERLLLRDLHPPRASSAFPSSATSWPGPSSPSA